MMIIDTTQTEIEQQIQQSLCQGFEVQMYSDLDEVWKHYIWPILRKTIMGFICPDCGSADFGILRGHYRRLISGGPKIPLVICKECHCWEWGELE